MSSLKAITRGVARDKKTRGSKDKANQRIENMSESDDISSDENDIALKMNRNPIVTKNAESSDLNFVKQYKNRLQYCNRGLFAIDTKRGSKSKENSASADGGPRSRVRARGTLRSAPHRH